MEIRKLLCEELRLPWHYVSAYEEDRAIVLVHDNWIQTVVQTKTLPAEFIRHSSLSNEEIGFILQQLQGNVEKSWKKLEIHRISKKLAMARKLPRVQKIDSRDSDLTYFQLLHYVSETNYMNRWKENLKTNVKKYKRHNKIDKYDAYNNIIREALRRLNNCPFIDVQAKTEADRSSRFDSEGIQSHLNSLSAVCVFESSSTFYIFYPYFKHSVSDCVKFSPAIFANSTIKPLFIIYQLLQATRHFHDSGLCLGDIGLNDIRVDSNLWMYVEPKILEGVFIDEDSSTKNSIANTNTDVLLHDSVDQGNFNDQCVKNDETKKSCLPNEKFFNLPLLDIVNLWTKGEISNFDYLMALNHIAGRKMGNPNYHPVLPWIMDFTVANGGWRDLSKSKFRLNKGDRQLELTYEAIPMNTASLSNSVGGEPVQVPHHVSDFLSEITYYVYKARQTPKSVLCHYVRSKWVPAEYPSSMRRLYEWTPDECIPEFFYDANIFRSIHRDFPDLEIPWWASSAEDFVAKHREALESQHVTERLHHWIDLTFGYKLSGSAAVKAKNVCYHLVDKHTNLTVGGIVQLFTHPHPHHYSFSLYLTRRPTCLQYWKPVKKVTLESSPEHSIAQNVNKDGNEEETDTTKFSEKKRSIHRSKISETKSSEHPTIVLPKDYIPLARLNQLESIYTFSLKATLKVPESQQQVNNDITNPYHQRHIRDMIVIGCLIVELFVPNKLKTLRPKATLEERYQLICSILLTDIYELPRCVKHCVQLLLQLKKIDSLKNVEIPKKMPVITNDGLPPPSAHQLLQPLIHIIPFPTYFQKLYLILCQLKCDMTYLESELTPIHSNTNPENLKITENVVKLMQNEFQDLLPQLNEDGLNLTIPYIKDLFVNTHTTVMAAWYLFGIVSQAIGPRQTFQTLIEPVVKLFDVEYPTAKHMKLFHRSYLLQLIVRLGLQTFLSCFSTLLIEAVGGFKDFSLTTSMNLISSEFTRHSSHLRSTEFEEMRWANDSKTTVGLIFSPFDENSSHQETPSPFNNKSELDDGSATTASEDQIGVEPEIFVFDNDDFNDGTLEKTELANIDNLEALEEIRCDNVSDSTSVEGLPTNETETDIQLVSQPNVESDQSALRTTLALTVKRPRSSCSFSEGFPAIAGRSKQLIDSESYSSSVPNLTSVALPQCSTALSSVIEPTEPSTKVFKSNVEFNISDVATETVIWLSHRLGPVLTAKYLSRNLLRMLSLCYLGSEQLDYVNDIQESNSNLNVNNIIISPREVVGDGNTFKVVRCLMSITSLYGVHFILLQYIPHMIEIVTQAKRRVTSSYEAGLIGNLVLIHHIVPCLSDAILMDHLQDTLIKEILHPTIRLISSSLQFPNGGHARQVIAFKFLDALYIIGLRIGFEMTRKHLTRIIQQFFSIFSKVHFKIDSENKIENEDSDRNPLATGLGGFPLPIENESSNQILLIKEELCHAFTPELAYFGYILFCKLAGGIYADQNLPNEELIHQLCLKHDNALSSWSLNKEDVLREEHSQSFNLEREAERKEKGEVTVVGNRIDIKIDDDEETSVPINNGIKKIFNFSKYDFTKLTNKMENESRHLKGNWLAYWEHELGRNEKDNRFNFKQIKLQTFVGHTNSVRTIYVLDNENSFISASKDKTVKLWSLRSHGDGSAVSNCQWTYNNHKKSVFSVTFLDSLRLAASCDSTVHVWDPFMGACLKAFDSNKNSPATVLLAMPPPSTVLISATTESSIRFLDVRTLKYMHEFKVNLGPAGLIRSLAVSPNSQWVAVGYSSGIISILDVRTGLLSSTWKGHEGEILQVKAYNDHSFVTSSLDQCVSVWNADDGKLKCHLRGPTEPVHCLNFYKNEMISGTTANRIGVHTSVDSQASFSSTRLQSDTFKGVLTSMAVLPQNRVLLLGADNGYIRLLC